VLVTPCEDEEVECVTCERISSGPAPGRRRVMEPRDSWMLGSRGGGANREDPQDEVERPNGPS